MTALVVTFSPALVFRSATCANPFAICTRTLVASRREPFCDSNIFRLSCPCTLTALSATNTQLNYSPDRVLRRPNFFADSLSPRPNLIRSFSFHLLPSSFIFFHLLLLLDPFRLFASHFLLRIFSSSSFFFIFFLFSLLLFPLLLRAT